MTAPLHSDEAQLVQEFFAGSNIGFFVEVGVRNPTSGSKTWPLEVAGWSGVLAEPQPDLAAFLVTARRAKVFAVACVAADVAGEPLPLRIANQDSGSAASNYVLMVSTRALDDLLHEAEAPKPLDLLALDVHGRELDALLGFDFERWKPRLVIIADPIVDLQRHRFLKQSGYRLIRRVGGCGWYVPAGSPARRQRWATVRDYYLKLPFRKLGHALRPRSARIPAPAN